jgi:hypothetical protein
MVFQTAVDVYCKIWVKIRSREFDRAGQIHFSENKEDRNFINGQRREINIHQRTRQGSPPKVKEGEIVGLQPRTAGFEVCFILFRDCPEGWTWGGRQFGLVS